MFLLMVFTRRKGQEPKERQEKPRSGRDPFAHLQDERAEAEDQPWFLAPDEAPDLEIEAGISSNLSEDDLEQK